ncbi:hypothetical protein DSO57_1021045 [Entomophthora muscae]|uniref:Uncharacterized protein n=1 Tax=Entomophthora muscae TaxID=34485 RepID=A0ACC2SGX2_9FUNG|nr:hypothetical protein DSO57_1021045 [Entomophthora muscae]
MFSVALIALDTLGWDATIDVCEFKELKTVKTFSATWLLFIGWIVLVCIFNGVVIFLALYKLWVMRCTELPVCQAYFHLRSLVLRV